MLDSLSPIIICALLAIGVLRLIGGSSGAIALISAACFMVGVESISGNQAIWSHLLSGDAATMTYLKALIGGTLFLIIPAVTRLAITTQTAELT